MNNICNVEVCYEYLVEADIEDEVYYNGKEGCLRDVIMSIKYNKVPLFVGVEQGSKKNEHNVYVLMTPKMRNIAQRWISTNYGKTLEFIEK